MAYVTLPVAANAPASTILDHKKGNQCWRSPVRGSQAFFDGSCAPAVEQPPPLLAGRLAGSRRIILPTVVTCFATARIILDCCGGTRVTTVGWGTVASASRAAASSPAAAGEDARVQTWCGPVVHLMFLYHIVIYLPEVTMKKRILRSNSHDQSFLG